jgi:hypothetical protein
VPYAYSALAIASVTGVVAPLFSRRIFEHAKVRTGGTIMTPGQRALAAVLRVIGEVMTSISRTIILCSTACGEPFLTWAICGLGSCGTSSCPKAHGDGHR